MAVKEKLSEILQELGDDDFRMFKWHLLQTNILDGSSTIPKCFLDKADMLETVDKIVQTYVDQSVEVVKKTLKKINRNDLVNKLSNINTGEYDELKLLRTITSYQPRLQSNLQDPFMCIQEGWTTKKDAKILDDIYTDLYITAGGDTHITRQLSQIQMASGQPAEPQISNIFSHPSGIKKNIRTVLTNGIAGIGKTFLVHKFVFDWAEKRNNQDVHLIFPFTFSSLNSQRDKVQSFAQLIHICIHETRYMEQEALNNIFTTMQTSGNKNFDKSEYKLLFVLDGLDESCLQLDFSAKEMLPIDVTESTSVNVLLTNLIRGTLLPSARLWITTRPAAANQIPPEYVDMVTEVRGFTDPQKYFRKRFRDEEQASRIISHIKTSGSLHIMCQTPVYCWIAATVLEDVLKSREGGELPKTLTEMYTEFLMIQIKHMTDEYGRKRSIQYIKTLTKLAFKQLEKDNLIFCEEDLKDGSKESNEVFVYSQVFSQIFKEEHQMKKDRKKMFSFVHQSIVEFLAALYVVLSSINTNINTSSQSPTMVWGQTPLPEIHRITIDKAVESLDGDLDLFLRFLLGLSLQTNQTLLQELLNQTGSSSQTNQLIVNYMKKKIGENPSPDRKINLFHCLNELNDRSLVEEIQQYLRSGSPSTAELSSAQWSALVSILLSSEKDLDVFDLKKYSASEEALLKLLPVVKASNKALLSGCNISERSCEALSLVLSSQSSNLRELDLSYNNLMISGVELLSAGLKSPNCTLETLRLCGCNISERSCEVLSSVLSSQSSSLRELDLRNNNLTISGEKLLSAALKSPNCTLKTLRTYNIPTKYENIISEGFLISSGSPAVYQLRPKEEKF